MRSEEISKFMMLGKLQYLSPVWSNHMGPEIFTSAEYHPMNNIQHRPKAIAHWFLKGFIYYEESYL